MSDPDFPDDELSLLVTASTADLGSKAAPAFPRTRGDHPSAGAAASASASRRRLPGPAGAYAERKRRKLLEHDSETPPATPDADPELMRLFSSAPWKTMLKEEGQDESDPAAIINRYNVQWVHRRSCTGMVKKAPALHLAVKSINGTDRDLSCVLADRTGTVPAMIHRNALDPKAPVPDLHPGDVLVLRSPTVIMTDQGGRVVVTAANLAASYGKESGVRQRLPPLPHGELSRIAAACDKFQKGRAGAACPTAENHSPPDTQHLDGVDLSSLFSQF